jgi:hypothetical protein
LTSALDGGECSALRADRFASEEIVPYTHWIGGWVDPRAVMDVVEKMRKTTKFPVEVVGFPGEIRNIYL